MILDGCEPDAVSTKILKQATSKGWMKRFPRLSKKLELVICGEKNGGKAS